MKTTTEKTGIPEWAPEPNEILEEPQQERTSGLRWHPIAIWREITIWNGNNHISEATGSWILYSWSQRQGCLPSAKVLEEEDAKEWLAEQGHLESDNA